MPDNTAPAENSFTAVCQKFVQGVEVQPDISILNALLNAGLLPNHSCKGGVCGSCETQVIAFDGALDHRDDILTQSERETSKTIMICVSRCTGARLVLDI